MSALFGALGSLIGYLGSEVAEVSMFENLLWPYRYNYASSASVLLRQSFLMTMGGPLHAAALATLDTFREHGLYLGACRGDMLGTAFYSDIGVSNFNRTESPKKDVSKESRNGFWVRVLREITRGRERIERHRMDAEAKPGNVPILRAIHLIRHLKLRAVDGDEQAGPNVVHVDEGATLRSTLVAVFSMFLSELSAIATAVLAGCLFQEWWLVGYMCIPLVLKLLALSFTVRRDGLETHDELATNHRLAENSIFEVLDPNKGFGLIEGPAAVIQQFFRHYGHPRRDDRSKFPSDRAREVLCIMIIYGFVLYFPAGLLAVIWMSPNVQYLWLSYQLYAILVMHVVRVIGWQGCGRTESYIAGLLEAEREVWLHSSQGCTVAATLVVDCVGSQAEGKRRVQDIISSVAHGSCHDADVTSVHEAPKEPKPIHRATFI